jgi:hypothetical protein
MSDRDVGVNNQEGVSRKGRSPENRKAKQIKGSSFGRNP